MAIRVRRGNEADFDVNKMLPGEWAVSLDTRYVRMCFAPGVCLRMATYEGFESDMERVEAILEEVTTIEDAINVIYEEFKQAAIDIEIASEAAATATEKAAAAESSASSASESAKDAEESASNASRSEASALLSAEAAGLAMESAKTSAENASESASTSVQKADAAAESAEAASNSEENASAYSTNAKSYAVGGTGTRENEDFDNAKYYMEQAKSIADIKGGLVPMGTISFSQLSISNSEPGYMYNISDEFTTTSSFKEGAGKVYPPGTNVYLTADGYWDCFGGSPFVSGVKGNAESSYRRGNVNITAANIGLGNVDNTADKDKSVKHAETAGSASANDVYDWAKASTKPSYSKSEVGLSNVPNVATNDQTPTYSASSSLSALSSGEKLSVAFGKIAKAVSTLISHISTVATASVLGHVKLSDTYATKVSNGAAANGLCASQNALYNAYNTLLGKFDGLDTSTVRYVNDESDENYGWVQYKEADGTWVNWKNLSFDISDIIKDGELNEDYTFKSLCLGANPVTITQETGCVSFSHTSDNNMGFVCTEQSIGATNFTKCKFTVVSALSANTSNVYGFGLCTKNDSVSGISGSIVATKSISSSGLLEYEVDISNVNGDVYVYFNTPKNITGTLKISDLHFE